jgi:hypothetical protein
LKQFHQGGSSRICSSETCKTETYPRLDPAVIMLVHNKDKCILARQATWDKGFQEISPSQQYSNNKFREVFHPCWFYGGSVSFFQDLFKMKFLTARRNVRNGSRKRSARRSGCGNKKCVLLPQSTMAVPTVPYGWFFCLHGGPQYSSQQISKLRIDMKKKKNVSFRNWKMQNGLIDQKSKKF